MGKGSTFSVYPRCLPQETMSSESSARNTLMNHLGRAEMEDVSTQIIVRIGDPQSELMKFLAESSAIQTIVWGGRPDLVDSGARQKQPHWLVKTKGLVECPIVVPSLKS